MHMGVTGHHRNYKTGSLPALTQKTHPEREAYFPLARSLVRKEGRSWLVEGSNGTRMGYCPADQALSFA